MIKNQKGLTFVEVLVGGGILAIVTIALVSAISQLFKMNRTSSDSIQNQQIVGMITESVKSDSSMYQINLSNVDIETINPSSLPMGFASGMDLMPRSKCRNGGTQAGGSSEELASKRICSVFVGFVIQPIAQMPGFYLGRVRIYTPAVGSDPAKDSTYNFMTTAK